MTVICVDELGPLIPRRFTAQPGWTIDGNWVKEAVEYWRDPEKTWACGGLRIRDGHAVTMCADRRNSLCYQAFLHHIEDDNPTGNMVVVTDDLSSHTSISTHERLTVHPRIRQVYIPKNACWFSCKNPGGACSAAKASPATNSPTPPTRPQMATTQLNAKVKPWTWGRPPPPKRIYLLTLTYRI